MLTSSRAPITINDPKRNEHLDHLTTHVHDCIQKLVSALDARASLLEDCGQLDDAMSDATTMMGISPTSPLGYLHAGRIFSYRGDHTAAIRIYDEALQHVPQSDTHYKQLLAAKSVSCDKLNKRVDFISQLPLDVVMEYIMPRILCDNIITLEDGGYLDVCRSWQERIAIASGACLMIGREPLSTRWQHQLQHLALRYFKW